jgi:hypothetical protein
MCSRLVYLAETLILTIDSMMLNLLRSSSFVPSWHWATQLSYSPAQTGGHKIADDDDISIYTLEELGRFESLGVREFVHTRVYDVNPLKKGEMDVDLPSLFCTLGWSFVMRFLGSLVLVEGIQRSTRWRDRDVLRRCCIPPSAHRPTSSTTSLVTMASNLMLKSSKDLSLGEWPRCSGLSGCSVCHVPRFSSHFITCLVIHIIITPSMHPSSNYLLVV